MATGIRKAPLAVGIPRTNSHESTTAAPPCTTTSAPTSSTTPSAGGWPTSRYSWLAMYHDIRTYIFNNTIGGEMANIPEFLAGLNMASPKKVGPLEVADRLEQYGTRTLEAIARARGHVEKGAKEFACTEMDLTADGDRKSTRLNSSHLVISYAVFCLK